MLYHRITTSNESEKRALFETLWEIGENAGDLHTLLIPQYFLQVTM